MEQVKAWLRKWFTDPFTVACDRSPFWSPVNEQEVLFQVKGLWSARSKAKSWIWDHPSGQARILKGHHTWEEERARK